MVRIRAPLVGNHSPSEVHTRHMPGEEKFAVLLTWHHIGVGFRWSRGHLKGGTHGNPEKWRILSLAFNVVTCKEVGKIKKLRFTDFQIKYCHSAYQKLINLPVLLEERRPFCPRSVQNSVAVTASFAEDKLWADWLKSPPVAFCLPELLLLTPKLKPKQRETSTYIAQKNKAE